MALTGNRIEIERKRTGTLTTIPKKAYEAMNASTPSGCPFSGYTFYDLLNDLIGMYDWKLTIDQAYTLREFLTVCNDVKAETYRKDFLRMEAAI